MIPIEAFREFYKLTRIPVPFDGMASVEANRFVGDIFKADKLFAERDNDYDDVGCTYKGIPDVSMMNYIQIKWGKRAVDLAFIIFNLKHYQDGDIPTSEIPTDNS